MSHWKMGFYPQCCHVMYSARYFCARQYLKKSLHFLLIFTQMENQKIASKSHVPKVLSYVSFVRLCFFYILISLAESSPLVEFLVLKSALPYKLSPLNVTCRHRKEAGIWFIDFILYIFDQRACFSITSVNSAASQLTSWRQFFMRLSCYWSWILS